MEVRLSNRLTGRFPVITVSSPVPAQLVMERINLAVHRQAVVLERPSRRGYLPLVGVPHVEARQRGDKLLLSIRSSFRNSLRPESVVEIVPAATGGSLVRLHPRSSPFMGVFMVFWVLFVGMFAVMGLAQGQAAQVAIPLAMLVFGLVAFVFGQRMARAEIEQLRGWLARCLAA